MLLFAGTHDWAALHLLWIGGTVYTTRTSTLPASYTLSLPLLQDGCVYIYDVLSGEPISQLQKYAGDGNAPVRDVSWHPYKPLITAAAWDGEVSLW